MSTVTATHPLLDEFILSCEGEVPLLFTENETNHERLFGVRNESPYVKDGINDCVVQGDKTAVNPDRQGTKAAAHYHINVGVGQSEVVRLRLSRISPEQSGNPFGKDFDSVFADRLREAWCNRCHWSYGCNRCYRCNRSWSRCNSSQPIPRWYVKYFDRIVVINVERRTDRLEQFTKEAERIGFDFQVRKAIDGQLIGMSPNVAGRLSHIEVLRTIKPDEKVLICEDDAYFREDFNEVIDAYMADLPEDWDIFYLGAIKNEVKEVNKHWVRQVVSTGTQAYCVNPAKVDLFIEIATEFEKWIDVAYRLWADRTKAYIAQPNLVIQYPGFSDLRGESVKISTVLSKMVLEYRQHSNRQTNTVLNLELQIKVLRHNLAAAVAQRDAALKELAEFVRKGGGARSSGAGWRSSQPLGNRGCSP